MKSAIRSKVAALAGRLADAVDGIAEAAGEAVRNAVLGLGAGSSPALVPVRIRERRTGGRR